jgi:poly(beta-D-mannuronate) lyase
LPDLSKSILFCVLMAAAAGLACGRPALGETRLAGSMLTVSVPPNADACDVIAPPARRIETASKYDQTVASRSVIDTAAAAARNATMRPIDEAIRRFQAMASARDRSLNPGAVDRCIALNARRWAEAASLTDMASTDANLTRDRVMAAFADVLVSAQAKSSQPAADTSVDEWLRSIAFQTMRFYDWKAGTMSRQNNHRYWAGLSVGRIGYLLGDAQMTAWAQNSLEIGLCQIDQEGFLPLELQRGAKAYDYHLYAYIALRSLDDLLQSSPRPGARTCRENLARLDRRIGNSFDAAAAFEKRTGMKQDAPARRNLVVATRMAGMTFAAPPSQAGANY